MNESGKHDILTTSVILHELACDILLCKTQQHYLD